MNFLSVVLSLVLLISLGTLWMLDTERGNQALRSSYIGYMAAHRKIFDRYEKQLYYAIEASSKKEAVHKEKAIEKKTTVPKIPKINPPCARLNLWELLEKENPCLQDLALKLIEESFGEALFQNNPKMVAHWFNNWLAAMQKAHALGPIFLEKLELDPSLQGIYYRMLKGSKKWDFATKQGYPSLLDLIKVERFSGKVCLPHAHPILYKAFFGDRVGASLYAKIRIEKEHHSLAWLEEIYAQSHIAMPEGKLLDWIDLNPIWHPQNQKMTVLGEDPSGRVFLRKTLHCSCPREALL